jgi:Reverse transcriptase (RNA-dependent DNA polymerase)
MVVTCGNFELDNDLVSKQLRQDFRDDWFPDPLGYRDVFEGDLIESVVSQNFAENHGTYIPQKAQILNIPKSNFTLRYALETSVADRAVYQSLASELIQHYDPLISWRVFSHRLPSTNVDTAAENRVGSKYMFRNGITAWSDFLGCVEAKMEGASFLLSTDLANYFENIEISKLRQHFIDLVPSIGGSPAEKSRVRGLVEQLFNYLGLWSFTANRGLPQNRDASSFLANIYMREVDESMIKGGYEYFRYMDDIKIVCPDQPTARKALKDLILCLRPVGQFVNSGKTKIVSAADSDGLKECLASGSSEMKRIALAWNSKSLKPISRSFLPLKNLMLNVIDTSGYDSREFRFCVSRLETLARCKEFDVPSGYFREITKGIIKGLEVAPVTTDQLTRYLRCVELEEDDYIELSRHLLTPAHAIYNWKNYRLWLLLTQRSYSLGSLKSHARSTIEMHGDDPTRAGATLYLGALGQKEDREFIAERFCDLSSFLGQRSALIAVHELHYRAKGQGISVSGHVAPFLRKDLMGSYSKLDRSGQYTSPLEAVSISNYVDMERDYA